MAELKTTQGRCIALDASTLTLSSDGKTVRLPRPATHPQSLREPELGDIVQVSYDQNQPHLKVLTPFLGTSGSLPMHTHVMNPRRLHGTRVRSQVLALIREFFLSRDFLETQTPTLVPCPGMEIHIRPFELKSGAYLPTSPEFAMKRLLVGGLERIFQICSSFRSEPESPHHQPEFTMLEWYRAYASMEKIMEDTECLVEFLAKKIHGKTEIEFEGKHINVATPWPRFTVRELFLKWADIDLTQANTAELLLSEVKRWGLTPPTQGNNLSWDDLYFLIWLNLIEPKLPQNQAVFVTHYPASQAALAVLEKDGEGFVWARRFELYAGGLELGNAFEELTDPIEQRNRFIEDMKTRTQIYGPEFAPNPLDLGFLAALEEGMPPSSGIAVGVDRLIMLLAGEPQIQYTTWLTPFAGTSR